MKSQRLAVLFSAVVMVALVLSACGSAATPAPTQAPAATAAMPAATSAMPAATQAPAMADWSKAKSVTDGGGMDALVAAAQKEGQLNVITLPRDWCDYGDMMDNFSKKYSIKINSINPDGGSADEIQAIKDNMQNAGPQAPDVLDIGPAYGPLGKSQNLFAPYKVTTWSTIVGTNDPDGYYFVDYSGIMTLEVNTDVVKNPPQDINDLLNPQYKGMVALSGDPRSSNQAAQEVYMSALANGGTLDNIQPGLDFFKKLNQEGNLLPLIAKTGTVAKGETPITFEWSWNAIANKVNLNGNPNLAVIYPKSVDFGGYYYQAVSAYAPHPAAARLWEEYLYSDEGQLTWIKGYCAPARIADLTSRNAVTPDLAAKLPDPTLLAKAVTPSIDQLTAARTLITNQWDSVVGLNIKPAP